MPTFKYLIYISCCQLCSLFCVAQDFPHLKFSHLSVKDGLSSNNVSNISQDRRGIIWITTIDGLNRYDGTGFKVFRHSDRDSSSVPHNDLREISLDDENNLWMATANGLCRFNTITGKAVNFYHQPANPNSLADNYEPNPYIDSRKRLWLATHAGVQLFDYRNNRFVTYTMPPIPEPDWQEHYNVFRLVREDSKHRLWAASFQGLYLVDEQQQKLIPYYQGEYMANNGFYALPDGNILLGQWSGGIKKFTPENNRYEREPNGKPMYSIVNDFEDWKDNNGNNWLCISLDGGVMLKDMSSGKFRLYLHDALDPFSLNANFVRSIFKDQENRLWLATDNGVSVIDPQLQYFNNYYLYQQLDPNNPKVFGVPRTLLETGQGYLMGCWFNKGLYYFNIDWKLVHHAVKIPENSNSFGSGSVNHIFRDGNGVLWLTTDSGLVKHQNGSYKVFTPPGASSSIRGDYEMRDILPARNGSFWIRAKQNGLYIFDPVKEAFIAQYKPGSRNLTGEVISFCFDKNNELWTGTDSGLFVFHEKAGLFERIYYSSGTSRGSFEGVSDLICDENNIIWAATEHGLGKINAGALQAGLLDTEQGLPDESLIRVLEDKDRIIWIKSLNGIIRYDKGTGFRFFNNKNGLPDLYNSYGLFTFNRKGNILSGQNGVLTEFNPYTIELNAQKPGIVLCDVYADNKGIGFQGGSDGYFITLEPGQKTLQVHFAISSYTSSPSNKFYYKVPGITNEWIEVPNGNINFSSIPIGKHTLHLRGSNNDGIFSDELAIPVFVKPYWYQTFLFKTLTILLIAALVIIFVAWRIRSIRKEAAFKQKIAETEMQALRAQMNPHFIFNSLNSIENFIMQNEKRLASDYLNKFARLIRMILDSSRNELVPLWKDMEALQLYIDLERLRFNNKFSYHAHIDPALLNGDYKVPSLLVQPYVENAIVHGLSHSEAKDLSLSIDVALEHDTIKYIIQDNGVGRQKANAYNLKNRMNHKSVGLKITEDRINIFNHSQAGNGTILFTDLYNGRNEPNGTKVEITIKAT